MAPAILFEWEGKEHEHLSRSADWYWALGIMAVAGAVASILFGNYLLAILVLVAATTLALHAAKEPKPHRFRVVEHGLMIGEELHPFSRMLSFSVLEHIDGTLPPVLSIKTESLFAPHLLVPLAGVDADAVYAYFLANVNEEAHRHSVVDLLAGLLGF